MPSRSARCLIAAAVLVTPLAGCGADASGTPASPSSSVTSSSTVSDTPSASDAPASSSSSTSSSSTSSPATPEPLTSPLAKAYAATQRVSATLPAKSNVKLGTTTKTALTVTTRDCTADACTGTMKSDGGATYAWSWDGSNLEMTRKPTSEKESCGAAGSSVSFSRSFDLTTHDLEVTADRIEKFGITFVEDYTIKELNNCTLDANQAIRVTYDIVAAAK